MNRLDMRGLIGPLGVDAIQRSVLYRALSAECGDIEVWQSERGPEGVWRYYWLVSRARGTVRGLALVRYSCDRDELEERIEGPFGRELWVAVEYDRDPTSPRDAGLADV